MAATVFHFGLWSNVRVKAKRLFFASGVRELRACRWREGSTLTSSAARRMFIEFFKERHGHRVVPSAPVRPRGDPSLLFVNAGMNQFKPIFLGTVDPRSEMARYRRVVNSQKCVRAGGKHNDLDDVGRDVYHHTFFEMLGNWSFGDYFKEEACAMAWQLLTGSYGIPRDRLYVSYFGGDRTLGLEADEETREIWLNIGVQPNRILPFGMKDNFWEMGETGPCGPCTEIHYDHVGGRDVAHLVNSDSSDVVEIWNLVFMQYSREADGSLRALHQHSVDTGMGLERLVAVLQGKRSNYDTDLFTPLFSAIQQVCPEYRGQTGVADKSKVDMAYRVIADHIRALTVCIADGVYPGMSGAQLVLRHILRRAVRFSTEVLKSTPGSLSKLVPTVVHILVSRPTSLRDRHLSVYSTVAQFLSSLKQGRRVIDRTLQNMNGSTVFPGSVAWSLHCHLGFPLDLLRLMVEEKGVAMDTEALDRLALENKKVRAQTQASEHDSCVDLDVKVLPELQGLGITYTNDLPKYQYSLGQDGRYVFLPCHATIQALICGQGLVPEVEKGQRCGVIFDKTCFYTEQGGQDHDQGYFTQEILPDVLFPVEQVHLVGGYVVHQVTATERLKRGDQVQLFLDEGQRLACMVKHTATHILNHCLRQLLGDGVEQRGSHVSADHLRFDFSVKVHQGISLSIQQLQEIEKMIRDIIEGNEPVYIEELPLKVAKGIPGLRTVDEVYPDPARVVSVGVPIADLLKGHNNKPASVELCCGTHLLMTGEIQDFVVVSERQIAKGVSRIVAVTGAQAKEAREAGRVLECEVDSLRVRLTAASPSLPGIHRLSKEAGLLIDVLENTAIPQWQRRELSNQLKSLQRSSNTMIRKLEIAEKVQSLLKKHTNRSLVVDTVDTDSISVVMKTVNQYSDQAPGVMVMLLSHQESGKVLCACQVAFSANDWALAVCAHLGGNAGGSDTVAKGTGSAVDIAEAIQWARNFAEGRMQQR
uniref:Alanine--tRNA ligase n=1 Tax=Scleropages formosus TaxID=113540 RepID=A0A8C9SDX1_SCLFO